MAPNGKGHFRLAAVDYNTGIITTIYAVSAEQLDAMLIKGLKCLANNKTDLAMGRELPMDTKEEGNK